MKPGKPPCVGSAYSGCLLDAAQIQICLCVHKETREGRVLSSVCEGCPSFTLSRLFLLILDIHLPHEFLSEISSRSLNSFIFLLPKFFYIHCVSFSDSLFSHVHSVLFFLVKAEYCVRVEYLVGFVLVLTNQE